MLKTGEQHLSPCEMVGESTLGMNSLKTLQRIPRFVMPAQSFAMIYDRKRDPENIGVMAYEDEDGELSTSWYLKPKSKADLRRRRETHRRVAEWTCGLIGRSRITSPAL